jgi:hypothetical protein
MTGNTVSKYVLALDDTDTTQYANIVFMNQGHGSVANAGWRALANINSAAQFDFNVSTPSLSAGSTYKMALAMKTDDFAGCLNGGTVQTDTSGSPPSGIDLLRIGSHRDGTYLGGWIRQITYIPRRLSNAELQSRSA